MKILILTQYFQPEPIFKGLPLARALQERGHDVQVLTGFPNYPGGKLYAGYRQSLWQRQTLDGIEVIRVPLFPSHDSSGLMRILNFLSFGLSSCVMGPWLVRRPDVIYVYNLITLASTWRCLRLLHGCKVVVDVQDLWPESVASSGMMKSPLAMRVLDWWCKRAYLSADKMIVLSPGFKKNLTSRNIDATQIDVIYNWCDESAIEIQEPDAVSAAGLGFSGKFNIVFAGTMGALQALDCIIDASKRLEVEMPDVLFTFVGGGIEVERLKHRAAALQNVQFLPKKPISEIGAVLSNADALLVHLKKDPIFDITVPSKIQAYMYAGKPVLCGVAGDASDLVRRSGCGVSFEPENVDSFLQAIRTLRKMSPQQLTGMGNAGKQYYEEHLSFRSGIDQIESVLESLVDEQYSNRAMATVERDIHL